MFACQSQALAREWYDVWRDVFQACVCMAGLALVPMLTRRPSPETMPRAGAAAHAPEPATPLALPKS
jgi:hypothetical protein